MNNRNYIVLFLCLILTIGVFIFFFNTQSAINYAACEKCDAHEYQAIGASFGSDTAYGVSAPFHTRILIPFIASKLSFHQEVTAYHFINISSTILAVAILYLLWVKLAISPYLILIGLFWLLFHWSGIVRLNLFDPITVDVPLYVVHTLLIVLIYHRNYRWLPVLALVATPLKESFPAYMLLTLLFAIAYNVFYEKHFPLLPLIAAVVVAFGTKMALDLAFPPSGMAPNSFIAVLFYIKTALINPLIIVRWLVATAIAFGSLPVLAMLYKHPASEQQPEHDWLLVMVVSSVLLGIIGGGDHTRIVFLGFPFIMTWVLLRLQQAPRTIVGIVCLLSLPVMHLVESIPEPVYATHTHAWFPEYAPEGTVALWGLYMLITCLITYKLPKWLA